MGDKKDKEKKESLIERMIPDKVVTAVDAFLSLPDNAPRRVRVNKTITLDLDNLNKTEAILKKKNTNISKYFDACMVELIDSYEASKAEPLDFDENRRSK